MIGVFDSGSGGLSVLAALRERAPRADVAYFGDIARAPYGVRSAEELEELTREGVARLQGLGATEIVSACNSVSLAVLAGAAGEMPAIEMTAPTARGMQAHAGKRVLLIATEATVRSGIYERALASVVRLDSLPIPELAGAIEFAAPRAEIARIAREAFASRARGRYDALLFGCTHYPLEREAIEAEARAAFGGIEAIDPAGFVAAAAAERFDCKGPGLTRFFISKESEAFRRRAAALFPAGGYTIEVP